MKKMTKKELLKMLASCNWMARALSGGDFTLNVVNSWFRSISMLFCLVEPVCRGPQPDMYKVQQSIVDLYNELNEQYIKL